MASYYLRVASILSVVPQKCQDYLAGDTFKPLILDCACSAFILTFID